MPRDRARQFHYAPELVFNGKQHLNLPLYFPYFHALELTLKGIPAAHNVPTRELKYQKGHKPAELQGGDGASFVANLIATSRPNRGSRALYTSLMPPAPIGPKIS
jgi:hypothetical protein